MRRAASLAAVCFAVSAWAVEPDDAGTAADPSAEEAMFELEQVWTQKVVTASGGVEEDVLEAAANVATVTRQDIALHGWRSLGEVLSHVPGLYVADDLVLPSVSVRGVSGGLRAGSRIIKVMINGFEVSYRPDLSALMGPEFIPIETVERIEIAKGPLSALYGANAFLATVNVITKKPKFTSGTVLLRHLRMNATNLWGRPGNSGQVSAGWGSEKATVLAGFSFEQVDRSGLGVRQTFPDQRLLFPDQVSRGDLSTPMSGILHATWTPSTATTLTLQAGLQSLDSMAEFRPSSVLTDSRAAMRNAFGQLKWQQQVGERFSFVLQSGVQHGKPTRDQGLSLTGNRSYAYRSNEGAFVFDVGAQAAYRLLDRFTLTAGADFTHETHDVLFYTQTFLVAEGGRQPGDSIDLIGDGDARQQQLWNVGVRLEGSGAPLSMLPALTVSVGGRIDFPNLFAPQPSLRVAAAYKWSPRFSTKLIVGRAFQTPSAVMLFGRPGFGNANNVVGARTFDSEGQIQPQVVNSAELVGSGRFGDVLSVDASFFVQGVDNLIYFKRNGNNFIATNRSGAEGSLLVLGGELTARLSFDALSPYASVTTQVSPATATRPAQLALESVPSVFAVVGLNGKFPKAFLQGNVHAKFVGARGATSGNIDFNNLQPYVLAPYVHLDASVATLGLSPFGDSFEPQIALVMKNLLDVRPNEASFGGFDTPTLGRTLMLDVRLSL